MGVLNFSEENLITGVNIIDGNLYWTDNLNEPKKLEIDRFREYDHTTDSTNIRGDSFNEADVAVIKLHPWKPITLELEEYNPTAAEKLLQPDAPFENIFPRFSYRWQYEDGQYSPYAPFTQPAFISKTRTTTSQDAFDNTSAYAIGDVVNSDGESWVAASTVNVPTPPNVNFDPVAPVWTSQGPAVYSSDEANYIGGYNTSMYNNVGKINLNAIPRGPRDVVAVEILYTESISSTIYVLETIELPVEHRGHDFILGPTYATDTTGGRIPNTGAPRYPQDYALLPLRYQLSARKIYSALPANQLSRPYDEVPQLAKAQEITANRLVYGNYQIGFDQPTPLNMTKTDPTTGALVSTVTFVTAGSGDGLHVKGNRQYEVGVAYIDAYGRQGAMLQAGSITETNGNVIEQLPLASAFSQPSRQQIQAQITSPAPPWADRYRYFIKDPSTDFHNLISYNIYNDGAASDTASEFIWIEFQSTDRNKVLGGPGDAEATTLILRRENDDVQEHKKRFLIQDIENEAPADVKRQVSQLVTNVTTASAGRISHLTYDLSSLLGPGRGINRNISAGQTSLILAVRGSASNAEFQSQVAGVLNRFVQGNQGAVDEPLIELDNDNPVTTDFTALENPLYVRVKREHRDNRYLTGGADSFVEVLNAQTDHTGLGSSDISAIRLEFGRRFDIDRDTGQITLATGTGLDASTGVDVNFEFITSTASDEAIERLGGRFFVRAARNGLETTQSKFTFEGELEELNQLWFETEPDTNESNLDLFWESSETFCVCTQHGCENKIDWYNSVAEVLPLNAGVYLETTRIFNKFNTVQLVKGVKVNVPTDRNSIIKRPYGLTWSGIYNGRTDTNRLNQFITADGITKELEPNYGSLQLLHTRDTNVIAACEDKIFRILADKDLLYNADGGGNVSASNMVLGQTTPFVGEYGISKNPESFASYGNNFWITDAARGVVLQVTPANGQINEVSSIGLKDHFRDRLYSATKLVGAYDDYSDSYMLSMQGYNQNDAMIDTEDAINGETSNITWRYEPARQGWSSRVSYIPEDGLSLNNKFYTYKGGKMFFHNSTNVPRNHFYNLPVKADPSNPGSFLPTSYVSEIEVILNENPSALKDYLTLGYEGTPGWVAISIDTDSEDLTITNTWPFVKKEDKYFAPIVGQIPTYGLTDASLGSVTADDGSTVFITGSQDKSGIKGFYNKVRLQYALETKAELFAINSENKISSN